MVVTLGPLTINFNNKYTVGGGFVYPPNPNPQIPFKFPVVTGASVSSGSFEFTSSNESVGTVVIKEGVTGGFLELDLPGNSGDEYGETTITLVFKDNLENPLASTTTLFKYYKYKPSVAINRLFLNDTTVVGNEIALTLVYGDRVTNSPQPLAAEYCFVPVFNGTPAPVDLTCTSLTSTASATYTSTTLLDLTRNTFKKTFLIACLQVGYVQLKLTCAGSYDFTETMFAFYVKEVPTLTFTFPTYVLYASNSWSVITYDLTDYISSNSTGKITFYTAGGQNFINAEQTTGNRIKYTLKSMFEPGLRECTATIASTDQYITKSVSATLKTMQETTLFYIQEPLIVTPLSYVPTTVYLRSFVSSNRNRPSELSLRLYSGGYSGVISGRNITGTYVTLQDLNYANKPVINMEASVDGSDSTYYLPVSKILPVIYFQRSYIDETLTTNFIDLVVGDSFYFNGFLLYQFYNHVVPNDITSPFGAKFDKETAFKTLNPTLLYTNNNADLISLDSLTSNSSIVLDPSPTGLYTITKLTANNVGLAYVTLLFTRSNDYFESIPYKIGFEIRTFNNTLNIQRSIDIIIAQTQTFPYSVDLNSYITTNSTGLIVLTIAAATSDISINDRTLTIFSLNVLYKKYDFTLTQERTSTITASRTIFNIYFSSDSLEPNPLQLTIPSDLGISPSNFPWVKNLSNFTTSPSGGVINYELESAYSGIVIVGTELRVSSLNASSVTVYIKVTQSEMIPYERKIITSAYTISKLIGTITYNDVYDANPIDITFFTQTAFNLSQRFYFMGDGNIHFNIDAMTSSLVTLTTDPVSNITTVQTNNITGMATIEIKVDDGINYFGTNYFFTFEVVQPLELNTLSFLEVPDIIISSNSPLLQYTRTLLVSQNSDAKVSYSILGSNSGLTLKENILTLDHSRGHVYGEINVKATQARTFQYESAEVTTSFQIIALQNNNLDFLLQDVTLEYSNDSYVQNVSFLYFSTLDPEIILSFASTYSGISLVNNAITILQNVENVYEGEVTVNAYQPASAVFDSANVTRTFTVTKNKFVISPFTIPSVLLNSYTFLPDNDIYFYTSGNYTYTTESTNIIEINKLEDRFQVHAVASGTAEITLTIDNTFGTFKTTRKFFFTVRAANTISFETIPDIVITPTSHSFPIVRPLSFVNKNNTSEVFTQLTTAYQGITLLNNVITISSSNGLYTGEVVLKGRQSSTPTVVAKVFNTSFTITKQTAAIESFTIPFLQLNSLPYNLPSLQSNSNGLIDVVSDSSLVDVTNVNGMYELYAKKVGLASIKITQQNTNNLFGVSFTKSFYIIVPNTLEFETLPSLVITPSTAFPYFVPLSCKNNTSSAPVVYSLSGTYSGMSIVVDKLKILTLESCYFGTVTVNASQIETTTVASTTVTTTFNVSKQTYVFPTVSMSTALVNTTVDLPSILTLTGQGALSFTTTDTTFIESINNVTKKLTTKSTTGNAIVTVTRADGTLYFGSSDDLTLNIRLTNTLAVVSIPNVFITPSTTFPISFLLARTGNNLEPSVTYALLNLYSGITIVDNEVILNDVSGYFTGTVVVLASQPETETYAAGSVQKKFNVIKQTSVFTAVTMAPNVVNATFNCPSITTLEGEGVVTFSTDSNLIAINNTTKKITTTNATGTANITVSRADGTSYFGGNPYTFPLTILYRNTLAFGSVPNVVITPSTNLNDPIPLTTTSNSDATTSYALADSYSGISIVEENIFINGAVGYYTGIVSVRATQPATNTIASRTVTISFTITKQTAAINTIIKNDQPVGSTFNLPTIATLGDGAKSFTNNTPSTITILNATTVSADFVGPASITAVVADGLNYFGNSYTFTFDVGYVASTLAFNPISDVVITPTTPPVPFSLTTTKNSTAAVDYKLVGTYTGISILDGVITLSESGYYTGTVTVRAVQLASATVAGKTVTATFAVRKQTTSITKIAQNAAPVNTTFSLPTVTRTGGNGAISFRNNSPTVITVNPPNVTTNSVGTASITIVVDDDSDYFGSESTYTFEVISSSATLPNFTINNNNFTFSGTKTFPITYTSPSAGLMTFSTNAPSSIVTVDSDAKTFTLASAGVSFTITAKQEGSGNYLTQTRTKTITVNLGAAQPITISVTNSNGVVNPGSPISNGATISLPARQYNSSLQLGPSSSNTDGAFTFSTTTPDIVDASVLTTNTLTLLNIGSGTLKVTQTGGGFYNACNVTIHFQVAQGTATIDFPITSKTYEPNGFFTLPEATSLSMGAYTYTTTSSNISLETKEDGSTTVFLLGAGETTQITATQASTTFFYANAVTTSFVVEKAVPILSDFSDLVLPFNPIAPLILSSVSTNLETEVHYSSMNSFVNLSDNVLTMLGCGECTVTATQAATANYLALEPVSITVDVQKIAPVIASVIFPAVVTYADNQISFEEPDSNSTEVGFTYISSDESVATVDETTKTITILKAGTTTIYAHQALSENYLAGSSSSLLTVEQTQAYIAQFFVPPKKYGDDPFQLVVDYNNEDDDLLYDSSDPSVASVDSSGLVTIHKKGETTITLSQTVHSNYLPPLPKDALLIVEKRTPVLDTFKFVPNFLYYLDAPFAMIPPSSSNLDVTDWSYTSSDVTVATIGSDNVLTVQGVGFTRVTAVQAADDNNNQGTSNEAVMYVYQSVPIITVNIPEIVTYSPEKIVPYTVHSTNDEIAVDVTSVFDSILLSSSNFTVLRSGPASVVYSQMATAHFTAIDETVYNVYVEPATPQFTFSVADNDKIQPYVPKKTIPLNAVSTDSLGQIAYFSSNESVISVDNVNLTAIIEGFGTSTVTAYLAPTENYTDATIEVEFEIQKATPTISNFEDVSVPYGTGQYTFAAESSNLATIRYTSSNTAVAQFVNDDTVFITKTGNVTITASLDPSPNYNTILPVTKQLVVTPITPTISAVLLPTNVTYGDDAFTFVNVDSNNLEVEITYTSSNLSVATVSERTVTVLTAGTTNITAHQALSTNFLAGSSAVSVLNVSKATPTLSFIQTIPSKQVGAQAFAITEFTSTNTVTPITYTSSNHAVATVSGTTITVVGAGTTTITAFQASTNNYNAPTPVPTQFTVTAATEVEFFLSALNSTAVVTTSLVLNAAYNDIIELSISAIDASRMFIYISQTIQTQNAGVLQQMLSVNSLTTALTKTSGKTIVADAYDYMLQQSNITSADVYNEIEWKLSLQTQLTGALTNKIADIGLLDYQNNAGHVLQPTQLVTSNNEFLYFPTSSPKNICSSVLTRWQSLNRQLLTTTFPVYNSDGNLAQSGNVQTLYFQQGDYFSFIVEIQFSSPVPRRRYKIKWIVSS